MNGAGKIKMLRDRCMEVFEDSMTCDDWLKSPSMTLGNVTPLSLLETDAGTEAVLNELARIEHGIIS
jgi:putative toxin-antitoxin system antitoxin component (TIGR02293 family)